MEKMLSLVRRLAEDDADGALAVKVLDFLWQLAHNPNVPMEIIDIALEAHKKILQMSYVKEV